MNQLTLTQIAQVIKRFWPYFVGTISFVLLIALVVSWFFSRPEKEIELPQLSPLEIRPIRSQFATPITLNSVIGELPKEMIVYQTTQTKLSKNANMWASFFDFKTSPRIIRDSRLGQIYSFGDQGKSLKISQTEVVYKKSFPSLPNLSISKQKAIEKALSFLDQTPLLATNFQINEEEIKFFKLAGTLISAPAQDAQLIQIPFDFETDNTSFLGPNPKIPNVKIWLIGNGEIIGFFHHIIPKIEPYEIYPLKTKEEALEELVRRKASLVNLSLFGQEQEEDYPRFPMKNITITKLGVSYFLPIEASFLLQPIIVFEAEVVFSKNKKGAAIFYLPAIPNQFFTSQP